MSNDAKLDKIAEDIGEIKITLAKQHVSLEHHIERSNRLERIVLPLERRSNMLTGIMAFIGLVSLLAGIYAAFKA